MLSLIRRAVDAGTSSETYLIGKLTLGWGIMTVVALPWVVFLSLFGEYCLAHAYPLFAMVEDEDAPSDELVSLGDGGLDGAGVDDGGYGDKDEPIASDVKAPVPVCRRGHPLASSSHRSVYRMLSAHGGLRASFRGALCFLVVEFAAVLCQDAAADAFGPPLACAGRLFARLALVQFDAAWVHIVMSRSKRRLFWQRLPPFACTLAASWRPVVLEWLASVAVDRLLLVLAALMRDDAFVYNWDAATWARALAVLCGTVAARLLIVPARVVRVRVQASLLPVDDQPLVPFDRSFGGKAGGRGYVSMAGAWATFSRAALRRVLSLYLQAILVSMCTSVARDFIKIAILLSIMR